MTAYLDKLPTRERQKIRERLQLSEAQYEQMRQRVKGPEDLKEELRRGEMLADANLRLKTEPELKQSLKQSIVERIAERGLDEVTEGTEVSEDAKVAIEAGRFDVAIESHPETHTDQLAILPEGRVGEVVPMARAVGDQYLSGLSA